MTINQHVTTFAGRPVQRWEPGEEAAAEPGAVAWRVDTDYDGGKAVFEERLDALLDTPWVGQIAAIVIGDWGETYDSVPPIERFVASAGRLTSLVALFLGDITYDESEISWITQGDITPLLAAYPRLEVLTIRGSQGLRLVPVRHPALQSLTIQCGGLPSWVVEAVGRCELPALTHLELWLGTDRYGGNARAADLAPLLAGAGLPSLRYLGLRDAEIAVEVAAEVAGASIVAQLETLDLSMGLLTDLGATALLTGQPLTHLRRLDLHHHFISAAVMRRFEEELGAAGVEVDLGDSGGPDADDRFIEVSE